MFGAGAGPAPSELWVERISPSAEADAVVWLKYYNPHGLEVPGISRIDFTVLDVDMDMDGVKDDDDLYGEVTEEMMPGAIIGQHESAKLTLKPVQPTTLTGNVTLSVDTNGDGNVRIWNNEQMAGDPLALPATLPMPTEATDLWIEGHEVSSEPRDITLVYEYTIGGKTFDDRINLTVLEVEEVTWKAYLDSNNVDDHPSFPSNPGKRIFPGKKTYGDSHPEWRKMVRVEATITPAVDNRKVYFSWWDVDDVSDSAIIDDNGDTGGDNRGTGETLSEDHAVTDGNGVARVTFTVAMNPGDNYRIAAALSADKVIPPTLTQQMADGDAPPAGVKFSPMLTVWRKLWIERDSMDAVADSGPEKNYVSGTASSYQLVSGPPYRSRAYLGQNLPDELDDEDQFDPGRY